MEKEKYIQEYLEIANRRKWWVIIPFVLVMLGSGVVYKKVPKIYEAKTLILLQPQEIPITYVQSTVSQSLTDRLATISQQILSRSSLEQVITKLHLIKDMTDPLQMEKKVRSMRKAIKIKVHSGGRETMSSFSISFEDENPKEAARIVNNIASLFIAENLKVREEQARGTSQFMEKELRIIEKRLTEKEQSIRKFKEYYMGELPAQLDANLRILERLQEEIQTNNQSIIAAQQRKTNLETQMRMAKASTPTNEETLLNNERKRLEELQTQYTDQHPDVIMAKTKLAELEAQVRKKKKKVTTSSAKGMPSLDDPTLTQLNAELQEVIEQIDRLTNEQADLKRQIALYQGRVERVPKREEQMSTLLRDYNLLQQNYRSLLDKKIQAQLAENLEKRQKGEQFKILDAATPPLSPVKPDIKKFFAVAFVFGMALGGGLGYLREYLDQSFYKADEVENFLGFPVIAAIPRIPNKKGQGE